MVNGRIALRAIDLLEVAADALRAGNVDVKLRAAAVSAKVAGDGERVDL